jgi:hypothetical protein
LEAKKVMRHANLIRGCALVTGLWLAAAPAAWGGNIDYVFHISVDGLRPDAITNLGALNVPNFYRMRTQGAFTDNARSDYDYTITLPSHVTQLTARPVLGTAGHHWTSNGEPGSATLKSNNNNVYIAGVCDVAHDNGRRTGIYASKTKFVLFDQSWNATNGAPDTTGPDNGRDKVDTYYYNSATTTLTSTLVNNTRANPFRYAFLHLTDPDTTGHASGWNPAVGSAYSNTVKTMDARLGQIFGLIDNYAPFNGHSAIILTADHGGNGTDHSDPTLWQDFRIPFYVWGPGVLAGVDLYTLNAGLRLDPGQTGRPTYAAPIQPIRNGEATNLALDLLGLGPIPGSTMNYDQSLIVPEPAAGLLLVLALAMFRRRR